MDAAFIWNLSKLGRIGSRRLQFDDDFSDRLNYQYTGVLLFLFIGLIGVRQYVGKPIQCWIPQEFTRGWEEYAENYCWVSNTYFAPVQNRLPQIPDRGELLIVYYQWAPIVMAVQALLFYLPCLTWRLGMNYSGFNLHRILQMAAEANELIPETANKVVVILSYYLRKCLQRRCEPLLTPPKLHVTSDNGSTHVTISMPENAVPSDMESNNDRQVNGINENLCFPIDKKERIEKDQSNTDFVKGGSQRGRIRKATPAPPPPVEIQQQQATSQSEIIKSGRSLCFKNKRIQNPNSKTPIKCAPNQREKKTDKSYFHCLQQKRPGNFLVTLYLFVKLCYLANVTGQLYLMQSFIGTKYTSYGARVLIDLIKGRDWHHSGHFPRVTFCDLEAKKLGKNHVYTLQCVLPLNMFLEKIYIFLWFWHVTIAIITASSLLVWLVRMFAYQSRLNFIHNQLKSVGVVGLTKETVDDFVDRYLGLDVIFIVYLISTNSGGMLVGDLIHELWLGYKDPKHAKQKASLVADQVEQLINEDGRRHRSMHMFGRSRDRHRLLSPFFMSRSLQNHHHHCASHDWISNPCKSSVDSYNTGNMPWDCPQSIMTSYSCSAPIDRLRSDLFRENPDATSKPYECVQSHYETNPSQGHHALGGSVEHSNIKQMPTPQSSWISGRKTSMNDDVV